MSLLGKKHDDPPPRKQVGGEPPLHVEEDQRLVAFVYRLLRDHIPAGEIETLVLEVERHGGPVDFSNRFLAEYARNVVGRLT